MTPAIAGIEKKPDLKFQNHCGEEAQVALTGLINRVLPIWQELYKLGKDFDHPIFKLIGKVMENTMQTKLTGKVVGIEHCEVKSAVAQGKVEIGLFPPDINNRKRAIKNKLKTAINEWKAGNDKIIKKNVYLEKRVVLLTGIASFIENYDGKGDSKPLFQLIEDHNKAIAA